MIVSDQNSLLSLKQVTNNIILGDSIDTLSVFPRESIKLTVTSPPYFKVRSYNNPKEYGLEKTLDEYLAKMKEIILQLYYVTKEDGFLAFNIGDVKQKGDFCAIPEILCTFAQEECDWIKVNQIAWVKKNKMPTSSKRGFTFQWESIYLFAKSRKRTFHYERVLQEAKTKKQVFNVRVRDLGKGKWDEIYTASKKERKQFSTKGIRLQDSVLGPDGKPLNHYKGFNDRYQHKNTKLMSDVWIHSNYIQRNVIKRHAAPFPPYIVEPFVKACSDPGDLVLDPFSGSGTTCIVAKRLGRKYSGIDIDEYWIKESEKRLREL